MHQETTSSERIQHNPKPNVMTVAHKQVGEMKVQAVHLSLHLLHDKLVFVLLWCCFITDVYKESSIIQHQQMKTTAFYQLKVHANLNRFIFVILNKAAVESNVTETNNTQYFRAVLPNFFFLVIIKEIAHPKMTPWFTDPPCHPRCIWLFQINTMSYIFYMSWLFWAL